MGAEVEWPFDQAGEHRDQLIEFKDFTRTTIRESRLNDVRLIGVEMIDAEIDGYIENLVVNGVERDEARRGRARPALPGTG